VGRYGASAGLAAALAAAAALVAVPSDALAKHKHKAPKPAAGTWTMTGESGQSSASFTVAAGDKSVSNVQITVDSSAATDCGTGTITIAGPEPIHVVKGGPGNKSEYIVGKGDTVVPQEAYDAKPLTVSVTLDGQTFTGQLLLAFRGAKATGDLGIGRVVFTNPAYPAGYGPCEFDETLTPPA
jgi:hypothetical protein